MLSAFANTFRIPELRKRILFTFGLLLICRLIALVPTPGVDTVALQRFMEQNQAGQGGLLNWADLFSGGALSNLSVGSQSIWPYISASIILQLLTAIIPSLERMVREGESGRQRMQQYTRYLTLGICAFQGWVLARSVESGLNSGVTLVHNPGLGFELLTILTTTTGTMLLMWLGEQITERGIGNGISIIIMANIVSRVPSAALIVVQQFRGGSMNIWHIIGMCGLAFLVTALTVMLTQGVRKVPIHTARRTVGRRVYGGQSTYMPLRVNFSGVMPIIFASPLIAFAGAILRYGGQWVGWQGMESFGAGLGSGNALHMVLFSVLIVFFSYFWVATQFNPMRIADDLKRNGAYVPGIRPGKATAEYLDHTMTRVTLVGAFGLLLVAVIPEWLNMQFQMDWRVGQLLGGTSLLIIVGVALDTMRVIESHLMMRHYDGFLKKGRLRGRA